MIDAVKDYLFRKLVADAVAIALILLLAVMSPAVLIELFNYNAWWIGRAWSSLVVPYLPLELALAGQAVQAANSALLTGIRFSTAVLNKGAEVPAVEAGARILLLGEAWVLKLQFSVAFRLLCWTYRQLKGEKQFASRQEPMF